jgi:hypothetical protein
MIRLSLSSKNPCTAALPPVGVQFTPQRICKDTNIIFILNTFAQIYTLFNRTPQKEEMIRLVISPFLHAKNT